MSLFLSVHVQVVVIIHPMHAQKRLRIKKKKSKKNLVNSAHWCCLLINSLDPDQADKLFGTLMVFLKEFFKKADFEKKSADDKKA